MSAVTESLVTTRYFLQVISITNHNNNYSLYCYWVTEHTLRSKLNNNYT